MRRHFVRFAALLTLGCFSGSVAWAHGDGGAGPTSVSSGHRAHGGGGGFGGGGHAGFGGGHGGHSHGGPSAGFAEGIHGDRSLGAGLYGAAGFSGGGHGTGLYGVGGYGAGAAGHMAGGSHLSHTSIVHHDLGAGLDHGSQVTNGINFPTSPALSHGAGFAASRHSAAYVAGGDALSRRPTSFIQNQVRGASGGGPAEHHAGDQVVQAGQQQVVQTTQAELQNRQIALVAGQVSTNRELLAAAQGIGPGQHGFWWDRSFFFGSSSPFGNSSSPNDSSSSPSVTYLIYPWLLPGYGLSFGFGYAGGGYGGGYAVPYGYSKQPVIASFTGGAPRTRMVSAVQIGDDELPDDQLDSSLSFAGQGEADFKQGKYKLAVQSWRHALVDDPRNGAIVLLLGQALFALGQYDEAAGATQAALAMLPQDKWGTVITHYKELYPNVGDYTTQIRALEKARDTKPDMPALHFLLGYHFGYLNYPKHAVRELDKVLAVVPQDKIAQKLRDEFAAKLSDADKAALDKQAKTPADDGKPAGDTKTPAKPDDSAEKPAGDKDDKPAGDKGDTKGGTEKDSSSPPGTEI